jgi:hypothetical protein
MRKSMTIGAVAFAVLAALAVSTRDASAERPYGHPVSHAESETHIFAHGGGERPRVGAVSTGLRHERVAHRRVGTGGVHYHPARHTTVPSIPHPVRE